jgi:hypothetical protein
MTMEASITFPCPPEHQTKSDWYPRRRPRTLRYDAHSKAHQRLYSRYEMVFAERVLERRKKDSLQAFARALTIEQPIIGQPIVVLQDLGLGKRFRVEAQKWEQDTMHLSSTARRVLHPSYQAIMGMGPDVVPILLRDMQQTGRQWFWALRHITGENPVDPSDLGKVDKMISAWIKWGKKEGKL